jgi:hypothetical protein
MRRYYCPACGQVVAAVEMRGNRVTPHPRASLMTLALGELTQHALERCPGGIVDRAKDRAP